MRRRLNLLRQLTWRIQGGGRLDLSHTTVEPFVAPATTTTTSGTTPPVTATDSIPKARPNAPPSTAGPSTIHPKSLESGLMSSTGGGPSSEGSSAALFSVNPHAQDAGSMHAQAQLPPLYDPGWRGGSERAADATSTVGGTATSTVGATLSTGESTSPSEKR